MANNALVTGPSVAEQNHAGVYFEHYNIHANTVNAFSGKFESCLFEVGKGVSIEDKSNDEKSKEETTPKTTMHSYGINKDHTSSKEKQFVTDLPVFSNVIQDQDDSTNSSFPGIIGQSNSSALVQSDAFECDQSGSHTLDLFDDLSNSRHKHTKKITAEHIHRTVPYEKKFRSERKRNDLPSFILTEIIRDNMSENDSLDSGFAGENCIDIIKSTPEVQVNKVRERKSYRNHGCFKKKHIEKILKIMKHANNTSLKKQLRRKVKAVSRRLVLGNNQSSTLVFGLVSYFERLNTDPPPTLYEEMHYEWLRLASFRNYSGSGSIIQLARHGFYHTPRDGPASTRCVYCDVCICNWSYFEDVASRHQQMSINCPVHHSTNPQGEFINDPIQRDNNNGSARIQTSQSVFTQIPLSSRLSMSVREVYRICGNQLNSMANPETVVAEVESTADAESQSVFSPNEVARRNFNQYYHDQPADVAPVPDAEDLGVSTRWNHRNEPLDQFGAVGGVGDMHPINEVRFSNVIQDQHDAIGVEQNLCIEMQDTAEESLMSNSHNPTTGEISRLNPHLFSNVVNNPFYTDYDTEENNAIEYSHGLTFQNVKVDHSENGEHEDGLDTDLSQESECEGAVGGVDIQSVDNLHSRDHWNNCMTANGNHDDHTGIKHSEYRTMTQRVDSFANYPGQEIINADQMASVGFFYTGVSDGVRCFYCGVGIEQWTSGDDPLNEHKRWSPSCGYLKMKLGEENESPDPHDQNRQTLQNRVPKKKVRSKVPNMKQLLYDEIDDDSESKERSGITSDRQQLNDNNDNCHVFNSAQNESNIDQSGNISDENKLLGPHLLCHICLERPNITRLPCGHLITCCCCTNRPFQCPVCNIERWV